MPRVSVTPVSVEQMVRTIRAAGKIPVQRTTLYHEVRRF